MRISQSALEQSEPLFSCFINCMCAIRGYHGDVFGRRVPDRDLFSETLRVLNAYEQDRTQSAYCLLVNGFVWDAEILIRTIYETFSKIALLSSAVEEDRDQLLREYWEVLAAIYDRQGALKAEPAERLSVNSGRGGDTNVFRMLRDARYYKVDPVLNKQQRKAIEQRWSFSGILDTLSSEKLGRAPNLIGIGALKHGYGVASHLAHADSRAMDLLEDRCRRGDDLLHLEIGHICRMLSDMVSLTSFSLHLSERAWGGAAAMAEPLDSALRSISGVIEPFRAEFERSQEEFYRSKGY